MQHVTGTVTKYNKKYITRGVTDDLIEINLNYPDAVNIDMHALFKPITADGALGPIFSSYAYEAVDKHFI